MFIKCTMCGGDLHPAEPRAPRVEGGVTDAVLAADVRHRDARRVLLQDTDDLIVRKPALPHRSAPSAGV